MSYSNNLPKSDNAVARVESVSSLGSSSQGHPYTDDDSFSSSVVIRARDNCTIGSLIREHAPVQRPVYDPVHNDAFRNLVSLLGRQTITDPIAESDEEDYDGDESGSEDDDHSSEVANTCSGVDDSADESADDAADETAGEIDASSIVEYASCEAEDTSSKVELFNNPREAFPSKCPPPWTMVPVTPLRSKEGLALTEGITLKILNILKAERQNKTLTNFQRASQYCYSLAQPIIFTEFKVGPQEYRKLGLIDYNARRKMQADWVEEGWAGPHVPNDSERRLWNNYNTREKVIMVVAEGTELNLGRNAVNWRNKGTWSAS